jgi:hypothetical protein
MAKAALSSAVIQEFRRVNLLQDLSNKRCVVDRGCAEVRVAVQVLLNAPILLAD